MRIYISINPIPPGLFQSSWAWGGGGGSSVNPKVLILLSWNLEVK